jgi:hypothetical protein
MKIVQNWKQNANKSIKTVGSSDYELHQRIDRLKEFKFDSWVEQILSKFDLPRSRILNY